MHVAVNGWFWASPHTGSGQYLRHLFAALSALAPDLRVTLVVPAHMRELDALPPTVDVLQTKKHADFNFTTRNMRTYSIKTPFSDEKNTNKRW